MAHELVVVLELVALDADDRPVVGDADQQIAALGVQERGDRLEHGVRDALVVLAVLLEVPAQRGLELQRLRLAALDQLLGIAVGAQVLVEEEVLDRLAEGAVVGDALVELEVRVDDLLDHVLDLLVEGEPHVLARVDPRAASSAASSSSFSIIWPSVTRCSGPRLSPKRSFSSAMMRESVSSSSGAAPWPLLGAHGVEHARPALEGDLAAAGLLDAVRLHVDVLLHLARQLGAVGGQQPPQVPREDVELLEVGVGEGQHLGEEGVEPHVVGELAAEVVLLLLGERPEALDHGREHGVELVLRRLGVEVDLGEARPRRPRCRPGTRRAGSGSRRAGSGRSPPRAASSRSRARRRP